MSDLARQRLKEIRTLRGWREAYRIAGLTDEGSDATKRRRLSRLINRKTSGAKDLDSKQKQKINRAYRYREKKGVLSTARADRYIKTINKLNAQARRQARRTFGADGISPDQRKLERRLRKHQPLSADDIQRIREAYASAEDDGGKKIRAEYARVMSRVEITSLPPMQRSDFRRRLSKAVRAAERDQEREARA